MRAFDVLSKAEQEIRTAAQPRYHFEMALLRWMHLRKLMPLAELLTKEAAAGPKSVTSPPGTRGAASGGSRGTITLPARPAPGPPRALAAPGAAPGAQPATPPSLKDALLAEIRGAKQGFYNTVVAQAHSIDVSADRISFVFLPTQSTLREWFEQQRVWLEGVAERLAGRSVAVAAISADGSPMPTATGEAAAIAKPAVDEHPARDLRAEAMSSSALQAMLDVFPAEIRDVEEM